MQQCLPEIGLDQNTTQFLSSQSLKARGVSRSRSTSAQRELVTQPTATISAPPKQVDTAAPRQVVTDVNEDPRGLNTSVTTRPVTTMGLTRPTRGTVAMDTEPESEGESSVTIPKRKRKLKSGINATPTDNIKNPQIWPQYNLGYGFIASDIDFKHISYEQYVAGESVTVSKTTDPIEAKGRLELMSKISYLKQKGHTWTNLRGFYAAVVGHILRFETSWASDWKHIEDLVLDNVFRAPPEKPVRSTRSSQQFYCRNFNKPEGCQLQDPHEAMVGRRRRQVRHFCAKCWLTDQEARGHAEHDQTCPSKE